MIPAVSVDLQLSLQHEISMKTQDIRTGLRAVLDLFAIGHQDVVTEAASANSLMVKADEKDGGLRDAHCKWAARRLGHVEALLLEQEQRCARARAEVSVLREKLEKFA